MGPFRREMASEAARGVRGGKGHIRVGNRQARVTKEAIVSLYVPTHALESMGTGGGSAVEDTA